MKLTHCILGLAGTVCLLSACNDDDSFTPADINATYADEALALNYSGETLLGKTVTVATENGETATLTLNGIVPGEPGLVLEGVPLTPAPGGKAYSFKTDHTGDGTSVAVEGRVQPGKLDMDVQVAMPSNGFTGTWNLAEYKYENNVFVSTPILIDIATSDHTTGVMISNMGTQLLGRMLGGVLKSIAFRTDGNIVATYGVSQETGKESLWVQSPLNLATYYLKDGKFYLLLNLDMILRQVKQNQSKAGGDNVPVITIEEIKKIIATLQAWGRDGIPLNYTLEAGKASVGLDETLLEPFLPLVQVLPYVPQLAGFAELIQGLVNQMTGLDITLNLVAASGE